MATRATIHTDSLEQALATPLEIEALDLKKFTGSKLPDGIFELRNLNRLSVGGGTLTRISPRIAELTKLRMLWLDKQPNLDLSDFPVMPKLEWLGLRNCKLRALPESIFKCRSLLELSLGMNPLKVVPPGIGALRKPPGT